MLTNMVTGDTYVGVTNSKQGLKHRLACHKNRAQVGKHNHLPLYKNINTYGWDNFFAQTLCEGDDEEFYCWLMQPTLNQCWVGRKPISQKQVEATRKARMKAVLCVETGKVYASATEASQETNALTSAISMCCKGTRNLAGGYHWKFVSSS